MGFFVSCVSHAFASVHCCLVVAFWERADLLALVGDVNCIFVTFPCGILGQVWYLIVSFPDLCHLSFFGLPGSESEIFLAQKCAKKELRQQQRRENFLHKERFYSNLMANPYFKSFHKLIRINQTNRNTTSSFIVN